MDADQMLPVAAAMAEAGHKIRIGVMGEQLDLSNDPRIDLFSEKPSLWNLNPPFNHLRCHLFMRNVSCLVMDWARLGQGVTKQLTDLARAKSIPSVSMPHGIDFVSDASYFEDRLNHDTFNHFDHIVTPNEIRRDVLAKAGISNDRIHVLGSARFTKDWINRLYTVFPTKTDCEENTLNIVHFDGLPAEMQAESVPLLKRVAELPYVKLALQFKPRQTANPERTLEWLMPEYIDGNHASQLCRWADITMFNGSSVALEALAIGRELIWLKHLDTQPRALEEYAACRVVKSDEELFELLTQLRTKTATPCPDPAQFLKNFVHGGVADDAVIPRYVSFLTRIQNSANKLVA